MSAKDFYDRSVHPRGANLLEVERWPLNWNADVRDVTCRPGSAAKA